MTVQREWYLPDPEGSEPIGPFTEAQLLERIRKREIHMDDYVWSPHLGESNWTRFLDLPEFKAVFEKKPKLPLPKIHSRGMANAKKKVELEFTAQGEYGVENLYRRFPRAPFETEVIIHNNNKLIKTKSVDISEKGMFLYMKDLHFFEKGEDVTLTVRNMPGTGTFSVSAVVIRVISDENLHGMGFFFLRLSPTIKRQIAHYILQKLKKDSTKEAA